MPLPVPNIAAIPKDQNIFDFFAEYIKSQVNPVVGDRLTGTACFAIVADTAIIVAVAVCCTKLIRDNTFWLLRRSEARWRINIKIFVPLCVATFAFWWVIFTGLLLHSQTSGRTPAGLGTFQLTLIIPLSTALCAICYDLALLSPPFKIPFFSTNYSPSQRNDLRFYLTITITVLLQLLYFPAAVEFDRHRQDVMHISDSIVAQLQVQAKNATLAQDRFAALANIRLLAGPALQELEIEHEAMLGCIRIQNILWILNSILWIALIAASAVKINYALGRRISELQARVDEFFRLGSQHRHENSPLPPYNIARSPSPPVKKISSDYQRAAILAKEMPDLMPTDKIDQLKKVRMDLLVGAGIACLGLLVFGFICFLLATSLLDKFQHTGLILGMYALFFWSAFPPSLALTILFARSTFFTSTTSKAKTTSFDLFTPPPPTASIPKTSAAVVRDILDLKMQSYSVDEKPPILPALVSPEEIYISLPKHPSATRSRLSKRITAKTTSDYQGSVGTRPSSLSDLSPDTVTLKSFGSEQDAVIHTASQIEMRSATLLKGFTAGSMQQG